MRNHKLTKFDKFLFIVFVIMIIFLLTSCGKTDGTIVERVEVCGDDSPGIMLPDTVVCNHSPSDNVRVDGNEVVYMCTKIKEGNL